jgi:DNA-binding Lrp family transcriptional regulator
MMENGRRKQMEGRPFTMAVSAYVFVECTRGKALSVARKLSALNGVGSCHAVTGPIDVIAFIEASDVDALGKFVVDKIQKTEGVLRTSTNIVAG